MIACDLPIIDLANPALSCAKTYLKGERILSYIVVQLEIFFFRKSRDKPENATETLMFVMIYRVLQRAGQERDKCGTSGTKNGGSA